MEYHYQNNLYKSGIYKITNKLNGRIYIGSSKLFKLRWKQHSKALRNNKHSNILINVVKKFLCLKLLKGRMEKQKKSGY